MRADLRAFLAHHRRIPFAWGAADCTLFAADWAQWVTGRDPAARWRGGYSSARGAQCLLAGTGGLIAGAAALGWERAAAGGVPRSGDIAVILHRPMPLVPETLAAPRFAVRVGGFWAIKAADWGVTLTKPTLWRVLALWRCPDVA